MAKIQDYAGTGITIHYDAKRCIHAAECVKGLPTVFDVKRKPWIDPNGAAPEAIVEAVGRCPSGALHATLHNGQMAELLPTRNAIKPIPNGPLRLHGRLEILTPNGEVVTTDTRMTLCRCGAAANKPFCDGSHSKIGFKDSGALGQNVAKTSGLPAKEPALKITPTNNGPLALRGPVDLVSADGKTQYQCDRVFLCRCGASRNKPFCDGSHKDIGFTDYASG